MTKQPTPDESRQIEPRPWTVYEKAIQPFRIDSGCHEIMDGSGLWVAIAQDRATADRIVADHTETASHLARIEALERALRETTEELATLIKGEHDDPSVGIVGWNSLHALVAANRLALAPAAGKGES